MASVCAFLTSGRMVFSFSLIVGRSSSSALIISYCKHGASSLCSGVHHAACMLVNSACRFWKFLFVSRLAGAKPVGACSFAPNPLRGSLRGLSLSRCIFQRSHKAVSMCVAHQAACISSRNSWRRSWSVELFSWSRSALRSSGLASRIFWAMHGIEFSWPGCSHHHVVIALICSPIRSGRLVSDCNTSVKFFDATQFFPQNLGASTSPSSPTAAEKLTMSASVASVDDILG
mmetsp:Transcript_57269/g.131469  ORF Transcript_57269/g.131469 Transcript_57269/m.131469 type:complete len:231 (-) Transcript_57269:6-698(-)